MSKARPKKRAPSPSRPSARPEKKSGPTPLRELGWGISQLFAGKPADLVGAVKMDHDDLRALLKILKDTEQPITDRRRAYQVFVPLLKSHSKVEERVVYGVDEELTGRKLHLKIAEGFVEHRVADDLVARISRCRDPLEWGAHVNVLAESLEHHLDEEERDLLPLIRRKLPVAENLARLKKYLSARRASQSVRSTRNRGAIA